MYINLKSTKFINVHFSMSAIGYQITNNNTKKQTKRIKFIQRISTQKVFKNNEHKKEWTKITNDF